MKKAVFFDRDGTLILDRVYLNDPNDIVYLPRVMEGLRLLRDQGFEFLIVTNQSGVASGKVQLENLHEIHRRIRDELSRNGIDILNFYFAPFSVSSHHPMRKPNPGMLELGIQEFDVDRTRSWMVGDRMTDVEAGHRAGLKSVFLYGTEKPEFQQMIKAGERKPEIIAENFYDLCTAIIELSSN